MKNILFITLIFFVSNGLCAQELGADDYVTITQENQAYPGFSSKTYRGLFSVGHGQFKMFNYGGTPGNLSALGADETLGSFVFNGYDGNQNVISAVIQAKTIANSRDPRINFLLSNGQGSQRPSRMTIIGQTGNVGIGVTDPTERIDVDGNIRMREGAAEGYIPISDTDGKMTWTDPTTILTPSPWIESGSSVYRADGFVGIGGFPSAKLHILQTGTSGSSGIKMTSSVSVGEDWYMYMDSTDDFVFRDDASNVLTLQNSTGNVGIGIDNPTARLHIETNPASDAKAIEAIVDYDGFDDVVAIEGTSSSAVVGRGYGVVGRGGARGLYGIGGGDAYGGSVMGVRGYATGSGGVRYGVFGLADQGNTNYGGYFVGNVNVTGTFSNPSDRKLKQNIASYKDALEVIGKLETKSYDYKKGEFAEMGLPNQPQIGFIAQEVEKILPNLVTSNVHPEKIEHDEAGNRTIVREAINYKAINYIGLIPVLAQGIKELSIENEELKSSNNDLEAELSEVKKQLGELTELMNSKFSQIEKDMSSCCLSETDNRAGSINTNVELNGGDIPTLEQNNPNPFYEQTVIKYYIPSAAKSATMTITDIKGSPVKSVNLADAGLGAVIIHANELPVGTYIYTLFVDGKQIESKQMILIK